MLTSPTPPCSITISQSENCAQANHRPCDPAPSHFKNVLLLKPFGGIRGFLGNETPIALHGPEIKLSLLQTLMFWFVWPHTCTNTCLLILLPASFWVFLLIDFLIIGAIFLLFACTIIFTGVRHCEFYLSSAGYFVFSINISWALVWNAVKLLGTVWLFRCLLLASVGLDQRNCCCSVSKSCPTLWDPMDCSMPGFPVHLACFPVNSWSLLKLMSIESVMPSNHLVLCHIPFSSCLHSQH